MTTTRYRRRKPPRRTRKPRTPKVYGPPPAPYISDGRWCTEVDRIWPENCEECRYRGAELRGDNGKLKCSLCAPEKFPPIDSPAA